MDDQLQFPISMKGGGPNCDSLVVNGQSFDSAMDLYIESEHEIRLAIELDLLVRTPRNVLEWRRQKQKNRASEKP